MGIFLIQLYDGLICVPVVNPIFLLFDVSIFSIWFSIWLSDVSIVLIIEKCLNHIWKGGKLSHQLITKFPMSDNNHYCPLCYFHNRHYHHHHNRNCHQQTWKKVKKFPQAEFLGFIISTKKCVILDMSKAMEKCENCSIFSKLDIYWSLKILHVQDTFRKAP